MTPLAALRSMLGHSRASIEAAGGPVAATSWRIESTALDVRDETLENYASMLGIPMGMVEVLRPGVAGELRMTVEVDGMDLGAVTVPLVRDKLCQS